MFSAKNTPFPYDDAAMSTVRAFTKRSERENSSRTPIVVLVGLCRVLVSKSDAQRQTRPVGAHQLQVTVSRGLYRVVKVSRLTTLPS